MFLSVTEFHDDSINWCIISVCLSDIYLGCFVVDAMILAKYVAIRSLMQLHTLLSRDATVNPRPWQPARARPPVECLWLLWQIVLKNVEEPLPVQHKPEIFSRCGWLGSLQQANKTPRTVSSNGAAQNILSVSSKNSSRTKPTSSEFVFLQLKTVELNIFQESTSITKRSPLRRAWFWKTRAEGSRKRHKDHL